MNPLFGPQIPQVTAQASHKQIIFVSNIDKGLTEEYLFHILKDYGQIQNIKIPKDSNTGKPKGIAFITYQKQEEAEKAKQALNGKILIKNKLKAKQYVDKSLIDKEANVFIQGLSPNTQEEEIENFFLTFGNVVSLEIKKDVETNQNLGYGYVQFEKKEEAQKLYAASGESRIVHMNGQQIKIYEFISSSQRSKNNSNIFIKAFCGAIPTDINMTIQNIEDYETVWKYNIQNWCNQNNHEVLNVFVKYESHARTPWALIAFKEESTAKGFIDYCEKNRKLPIVNLHGAKGAVQQAQQSGATIHDPQLFDKLNSNNDPFSKYGDHFFYNYQKTKTNTDIDQRILIVRSLKKEVTLESLQQFLSQFGKVIKITLKAHRNPRFQLQQAIVTYQTVSDAVNCLSDIFKLKQEILSEYFQNYPWVSILVNSVYRKELKIIKDQTVIYKPSGQKNMILPINSQINNKYQPQQQQFFQNPYAKLKGPVINPKQPFQGGRPMTQNQQQHKFQKGINQFQHPQKFPFVNPGFQVNQGVGIIPPIAMPMIVPSQLVQAPKAQDKYTDYEIIQNDMQGFTQLSPQEQRIILGQLLSKKVAKSIQDPNLVPKVTGMLIDEKVFEIQEIMEFFDSNQEFQDRIEEAMNLIADGN